MEQTMQSIDHHMGNADLHIRKTGWTDAEANLLWETAEEAGRQGLALKSVFEKIAGETGRRPNSIRNYYYAQVRERLDGAERAARFVPFEESEVVNLLEQVLRDRAQGHSVRSCLQRISQGDHSLMLRYQNKYRSLIKTRPNLVQQVVDQLNAEGIDVKPPEVKPRSRTSLSDALGNLSGAARQQGDPELIRALETIGDYLLGRRSGDSNGHSNAAVKIDLYRMALDEQRTAQLTLSESSIELIAPIKEFLALDRDSRMGCLDQFAKQVSERIGALEACLAVSDAE